VTRITEDRLNVTAGEIKPSLHAREDLSVFQNGVAVMENRIPLPEGASTRRPGTRMVLPLADETQPGALLPFKFSRLDARMLGVSAGQAVVLKSGGYILSGGAPYSFAVPFLPADYANIRFVDSGNEMFVAYGKAPLTIVRLTDTNWTVQPYVPVNGPTRVQNTDTTKTILASGVSGAIALTANFDVFNAAHVGSLWRLDEGDLGTIAYWTASEKITVDSRTNNPTTYRRYQGKVYAAYAPGGGLVGSSTDCGVNPPTQLFGSFMSSPASVSWLFLYQNYGFVQVTAVADARHASASVLGIGETAQTVLPDSVASLPTYRWSEPAWSNVRGWPNLVCFAQQRLVFLRGNEFWLTNTGDDFRYEATTAADSAIYGTLLSIDGSVILPQWAVASGWIVVGAADTEPVIRGPGAYDALTQQNVLAIVDKGEGSAWHKPTLCNGGVLAIGTSRQRLNFVKIDRLIETIRSDEISLNANHVLAGLAAGVVYQHDPNRVAYGFSQNGDLWSATFRPEQQVIGFARHPMPGAFVEDMAAIPSADGLQTEIWMIVRRVVNGATRRFYEVLQPFFQSQTAAAPTAAAAWYVDCALQYLGAPPINVILGLQHLAGATARVFDNGAWLGDYLVSPTGQIQLPAGVFAHTGAIAGLPIVARQRSLPLDPVRPGSTTSGDVKRATHAVADFFETFGGEAFCDAYDFRFARPAADAGRALHRT
jgi:hypothetical protein